jgi:hypothetical protein
MVTLRIKGGLHLIFLLKRRKEEGGRDKSRNNGSPEKQQVNTFI